MTGFTVVDAIVVALVLLSALFAYSRGAVRELSSIASWAVAAVAAYSVAIYVEPLAAETPVIRDFVRSCGISVGVAFGICFVVFIVLFAVFTPMLSLFVKKSIFSNADQMAGFIYGALRGGFLALLACFVVEKTIFAGEGFSERQSQFEIISGSKTMQIYGQVKDRIPNSISDPAFNWISGYHGRLVAQCEEHRGTAG